MDGGRPRIFPGRRDAVSSDGSDDARERVLFLGVGEVPGVVFWREMGNRGNGPNLEEVHLFGAVCLFAVADSRAGRGELDVAAFQDFGVAHRVFAVMPWEANISVRIAKLRITKRTAQVPLRLHTRRSRIRDGSGCRNLCRVRRDLHS